LNVYGHLFDRQRHAEQDLGRRWIRSSRTYHPTSCASRDRLASRTGTSMWKGPRYGER
jgi:hypothetical protein